MNEPELIVEHNIHNVALDVIDKSLDVFEAVLKDFGDEAATFGSELEALARKAWRSRRANIKPSFVAQMKDLLTTYLRDSYIEGLAEGGVEEDEMDRADERAIVDMYQEQIKYVDGFADAVVAARDEEELRAEIDRRIVYWSRSIAGAAQAGLTSAQAKEIVVWRYGKAEEHCATCRSLNGQRHTRQWFASRGYVPQTPGASMDCAGFNCSCELVLVRK